MAVALPRHRLDHPVSLQDVPELLPLVLPALVAVEQGSSHLPFPSSERVLHPLADLREVGTRRYAVADDPPAVEVHHRRQVELPVRELELRDVRDELPVRPLGREASRKQVRRYLADLSPVGAVRSSLLARLPLQGQPVHDSLDLLVVDPLPVSPQGRGDTADAVSSLVAGENSLYLRLQRVLPASLPESPGMELVGGLAESEGLEQALEAVALGGKTVGYLRFFLAASFRSPRARSSFRTAFSVLRYSYSSLRTFSFSLSESRSNSSLPTSNFSGIGESLLSPMDFTMSVPDCE